MAKQTQRFVSLVNAETGRSFATLNVKQLVQGRRFKPSLLNRQRKVLLVLYEWRGSPVANGTIIQKVADSFEVLVPEFIPLFMGKSSSEIMKLIVEEGEEGVIAAIRTLLSLGFIVNGVDQNTIRLLAEAKRMNDEA